MKYYIRINSGDINATMNNSKEVGALTVPNFPIIPNQYPVTLPFDRIRTHENRNGEKVYFTAYGPLDQSKFGMVDWNADENRSFTRYFASEGADFDWVDENGKVVAGSNREGFEGIVENWGNGNKPNGKSGTEAKGLFSFLLKYWWVILLLIVFRKTITQFFKTSKNLGSRAYNTVRRRR